MDKIERYVAQLTVKDQRIQLLDIIELAVPRLASTRAGGNVGISQSYMQAAFLKVLLTFDDPTLLKPPPDHLPLAKSVGKPHVVRAEDLVRWSSARATTLDVTATHRHVGPPDITTSMPGLSPPSFIERPTADEFGLVSIRGGVLDLGRQTRYESIESEPRKHDIFPVCIPSHFHSAAHNCTASYIFIFILVIEFNYELPFLIVLCSAISLFSLVRRCGIYVFFAFIPKIRSYSLSRLAPQRLR